MHRALIQSLRQAGLSLIELMIAMLVGLILIAGVISVFLSSRKSYGINTAVGQIQEHGRFALNFIQHDTRMAGYLSCGVSGLNFANQLNPTASLPYNFTNAITGFEYKGTAPGAPTYTIASENPAPAAATSNWAPDLDSSLPLNGAGYAIPGSDVLAMSLSQGSMNPGYVVGVGPAAFVINSNPGISPSNDILVVSNCVNTVIVQASGPPTGATGAITIPAATGGPAPGDAVASIPPSLVGAQVGTAQVVAFYVGEGADGAPALFQATTDPTVASGFQLQEIVPGVENMQVLYGVDTTGSSTPTTPTIYMTADAVAAAGLFNSVVSVRVALMLRSDTGAVTLPPAAVTYNLLGTVIAAPVDTRLRQTFTTTIFLRNQ